jgi:hypothetical protein
MQIFIFNLLKITTQCFLQTLHSGRELWIFNKTPVFEQTQNSFKILPLRKAILLLYVQLSGLSQSLSNILRQTALVRFNLKCIDNI